jgi:hypothetical protein
LVGFVRRIAGLAFCPRDTSQAAGQLGADRENLSNNCFYLTFTMPKAQDESARRMQDSPGGRFFQKR